MTIDKNAARIRALLNLAEHPGTPEHERLLAAEKAAELMEKHAITELMARGTGKPTSDVIISRHYLYDGVYWYPFLTNIHALARAVDMRSYYYRKPGSGHVRVTVVGFESDFPKFETLHASMELQVVEAWKVYRKAQTEWSWLSGNEKSHVQRSYKMGYASGFAARVKAARNTAVEESTSSTSTALVLVDRKAAVDNHLDNSVTLKSSRGSTIVGGAYRDGQRDGNNARTGNTNIGERRGALGR